VLKQVDNLLDLDSEQVLSVRTCLLSYVSNYRINRVMIMSYNVAVRFIAIVGYDYSVQQ